MKPYSPTGPVALVALVLAILLPIALHGFWKPVLISAGVAAVLAQASALMWYQRQREADPVNGVLDAARGVSVPALAFKAAIITAFAQAAMTAIVAAIVVFIRST